MTINIICFDPTVTHLEPRLLKHSSSRIPPFMNISAMRTFCDLNYDQLVAIKPTFDKAKMVPCATWYLNKIYK